MVKFTHYFWKKEYQARGATHYCVLLWIDGAPVIGKYSAKDVLTWIQNRAVCHISDEKTSRELHRLVTKFQLHNCSKCCNRTKSMAMHLLQSASLDFHVN